MSGIVTPDGKLAISHDDAIEAVCADETAVLDALPRGTDLSAYTRCIVSRHVFAILTAGIPPTMHPEYEMVTVWRRASRAAEWRMHERWVRAPGGDVDPLARLDEHFRVMREA